MTGEGHFLDVYTKHTTYAPYNYIIGLLYRRGAIIQNLAEIKGDCDDIFTKWKQAVAGV